MSYLNCLNKKDKIIIVMLFFFLFVIPINAQERILNLVLIQDESEVRILDRTVSTTKTENEFINLIGYKFVIKDSDDNIAETINFGFSDNVAVLSIPVSQNFIRGEIYDDKDNLILEVDLYSHIDIGLCGDSACSGDETYESCPQDCFLQREDLFLEREIKRESKLPLIILYSAIAIVVFLIIIFSVIFVSKKTKLKSKEKFSKYKENEIQYEPISLEQQLQQYVQQSRQEGLSKEEIKNELLNSGWPLDLIEKNLK